MSVCQDRARENNLREYKISSNINICDLMDTSLDFPHQSLSLLPFSNANVALLLPSLYKTIAKCNQSRVENNIYIIQNM